MLSGSLNGVNADLRRTGREIRDLLWEWDFLGVGFARGSNEDEYDCLEWRLYQRLKDRCTSEEIKSLLDAELRNHFGIEPPGSTAIFVEKLLVWWESRAGDQAGDSADDTPQQRFEEAEDRWWLEGCVPSELLPAIATDGLVAGMDSRPLRVLAGNRPSDADENRRLFAQALEELGRVPPVVDPFLRIVSRVVDGILHGRIEPCRRAHRLYWMGSEPASGEASTRLAKQLSAFAVLADECEQPALDLRASVQAEIIEKARTLAESLNPGPV